MSENWSAGRLSYQVLRAYEQTALDELKAMPIFPPGPPYVPPSRFSRRWWRIKTRRFREARIWQWRIINKEDVERLDTW